MSKITSQSLLSAKDVAEASAKSTSLPRARTEHWRKLHRPSLPYLRSFQWEIEQMPLPPRPPPPPLEMVRLRTAAYGILGKRKEQVFRPN